MWPAITGLGCAQFATCKRNVDVAMLSGYMKVRTRGGRMRLDHIACGGSFSSGFLQHHVGRTALSATAVAEFARASRRAIPAVPRIASKTPRSERSLSLDSYMKYFASRLRWRLSPNEAMCAHSVDRGTTALLFQQECIQPAYYRPRLQHL